jgi:hypothetical protein
MCLVRTMHVHMTLPLKILGPSWPGKTRSP